MVWIWRGWKDYFIRTLLSGTVQPIPYPLNNPPIKSISLQCREKDVVWDHAKDLPEVQIRDICCPLMQSLCCRRSLGWSDRTWLSWITSLSCMCHRTAAWRMCPMNFPGTEWGWQVSVSFFLPFSSQLGLYLTAITFQICKVAWQLNPPVLLRSLECCSLGPRDLFIFRFLKWAWTWPLL